MAGPGVPWGEERVRELLDLADSGLPHASAADLGRPGPREAGSPPETALRRAPGVGGQALIRVWEWVFWEEEDTGKEGEGERGEGGGGIVNQ